MFTINDTLTIESRALHLRDVIASAEFTDRGAAVLAIEAAMTGLCEQLLGLRARGSSLYVVGNGGSAALAAHAVTDFLKVGGIRAHTLHDASLVTCLSNDYSYEEAFARALDVVCRPADMVIAVSSSGRSANIRNAAAAAHRMGAIVITLSGFERDNPLRSLGDFNVWLDSKDYGMVEIGHQFVLHNLSDRLARTQ